MDYNCDLAKILYESEQNDMAIFEAIIETDMYILNKKSDQNICESELATIQEASVSDFLNTIGTYIEKLADKIKEVVDKFCEWLKQTLQPSGVSYLVMYQNRIIDPVRGEFIKDFSEFKYKIKKRTKLQINTDRLMNIYTDNAMNSMSNIDDDDKESITKVMNGFKEDNNFVCELLSSTITNSDTSKIEGFENYKKFVEDNAFQEEKEYTGFTTNDYSIVSLYLANVNNKAIHNIQNSKNKAIKDLKKTAEEFRSDAKHNKPKANAYKANAQFELMRMTERSYIETYTAFMWLIRTEVSQAKSLYAKLAMYNPKVVAEDTELIDYISSTIYDETYDMI